MLNCSEVRLLRGNYLIENRLRHADAFQEAALLQSQATWAAIKLDRDFMFYKHKIIIILWISGQHIFSNKKPDAHALDFDQNVTLTFPIRMGVRELNCIQSNSRGLIVYNTYKAFAHKV